MTDAPERIWAYKWHQYETRNGPSQTEYTRSDLCLTRDDPRIVALVEALQWVVNEGGYAHRSNITGVAKDALAKWEEGK